MLMARCLSDFEGDWRIMRTITNASGPDATFVGRANWTPKGEGLLYVETGELHMSGQPAMHAERRYFWDAQLGVWFDDGRFFHQVPASGGDTAHWCDPDQYDVHYDFSGWPSFETRWKVRGPRKNYAMITQYSRQ